MPASPAPDPVLDGQESVWDYPRPPAVRPCSRSIEVSFGGHVVCRTTSSLQVLETSHPPVYYLPRSTFTAGALRPARGASLCEWKGAAAYLDIVAGGRMASAAAWYYPNPSPGFEALAGHVAVYAGRVDGCFVDGRRVQPQPGGFYGGWITPDVAGPFKGAPGTSGW